MAFIRADVTRNGIIVSKEIDGQVTSETLDLEYPLVQFYHRFQDFIAQFSGDQLTVESEYTHYQITTA